MSNNNLFKLFVDDFEEESERFLIEFGYQDALTNPQPIDIRDIVTRIMSLNIIQNEKLSPDFTVQGIITFSKGIVQVYDCQEMEYVGYEVESPTVFIDADILSDGCINEILAHEAFHWYKHRKYFVCKNNDKRTGFAFRCDSRYSMDKSEDGWSDEETMEWQARKIAPMLLLPRQALINKAHDLAGWKIDYELPGVNEQKKVIAKLAAFFHVTDNMIVRRLQDLGYGVSDEGHYVTYHMAKSERGKVCVDGYQNPRILLKDAFELYRENVLFRSYIDTGFFKYRSIAFFSVFQLRSADIPDYLTFGEKLIPQKDNDSSDPVMFYQDQRYVKKKTFSDTPQNQEVLDRTSHFIRQYEDMHERKSLNAISANKMICSYMEQAKWNVTIFQEKTLLSPMDYTRLHQEHKFKLQSYVAMAVGLGLSLSEFQNVIKQAGMILKDGDKTDDAYSFILSTMQGMGIDECNDFLEEIGVSKLGTHSKDW